MKILKKSFNKVGLAFLILIIVPLVSAFRGPATNNVKTRATKIIFQSNDNGQTWEDISLGLPENEKLEDFFAGETDLYLRVKNEMYSSKSNLKTPVWIKENVLPAKASIAFNRSGVIAYNYEGEIYQRSCATGTWLPVYPNFKKDLVRNVFEASDGTVFLGCEGGLYKSADKGKSWKQVQKEKWVMDLVESEGVLVATGEKGIMRSIDKGEHWEWVISEGGVGIAIERIDQGFAAISYNTKTLTRRIHISLDGGKTWKAIDGGLPPAASISSIKQIGNLLFCGHPDGIFRSSDMGQTWNKVYPSTNNSFRIYGTAPDNGKVYKIYVSNDVLYAVLKESGC